MIGDEPRLSEESWTSHEAESDTDALGQTTIKVKASTDENLQTRYFKTVKALKREIDLFNTMGGTRMYLLDPVLLAEDVDADVLEELPSLVGDSHVKLVVRNRRLLITNLSGGSPHGCAVASINQQAGSWSRSAFSIMSDTTYASEDRNNGSAPDLVIEVPTANLPDGAGQQRLGE